jgi:hypothetical protein
MLKQLLYIWLMLSISFISSAQPVIVAHSNSKGAAAIEEKIIDIIFKLPEFRERAAYIEKQTKGKRHLGIIIYERPSKGRLTTG